MIPAARLVQLATCPHQQILSSKCVFCVLSRNIRDKNAVYQGFFGAKHLFLAGAAQFAMSMSLKFKLCRLLENEYPPQNTENTKTMRIEDQGPKDWRLKIKTIEDRGLRI